MNGNQRHVTLDALRGLGAVTVLLTHIGYVGGDRSLARFGFLAVDLFFIMSGFVIGRAYEEKLRSGMSWRHFMLLRLARFYPSLFLGVVAGLVAYFVIPGGTYRLGWYSLGHLVLVPDLTAREGIFPLNGVLWTLFFELAINAVHALVLRWLTTARLAVIVLAMGLWWAYAASSSGNWGGGWNVATFVSGFARVGWGYGAGLLLHRLMKSRWKVPPILWTLPIVLAAVAFLWPSSGVSTARVMVSLFLLCPLMVFLAVSTEVPPFARGAARWLGGISYPLYAIHLPLLLMIASRFDVARAWMLVAAAIIAVATAVEYAYDAPLRKRLIGYVAAPRPM